MSRSIRELIRKGDPRLSVNLSKPVKQVLSQSAKKYKRSLQDEIIHRLAISFQKEEVLEPLRDPLMASVRQFRTIG